MGNEIIPGIVGPPSMPSGDVSLPPGTGRINFISVRDANDGTVTLAETLLAQSTSKGRLPGNGLIDVRHVPLISVYLLPTFGSGGLTAVYVTPFFSDTPGNGGYGVAAALSAGVMTLSKARYKTTVDGLPIIFPIQNPGANYLQLYMSADGVITGSACDVMVGLGWGSGNQVPGV